MKNIEYQLVVCIVNTGFSDAVMDAAKEAGARGGTIINAHGTANKQAEKFFNITIQPEKEMVMIIVKNEIKEAVLHALYQSVGLNTAGNGIAFSLPIDNVVGLTKPDEHMLHEFNNTPDKEKSKFFAKKDEPKEDKNPDEPKTNEEVTDNPPSEENK